MMRQILRALIIATSVCVSTAGVTPRLALADDASRISQLELEIQRLRTLIDDQSRRIQRLEEELRRRQSPGFIETTPEERAQGGLTSAPPSTKPLPWHAAKSWARVARGMSETEVTGILGPPASVESISSLKTLFYRGTVAGVGSVSGIVNLRDGRVVAVNAPEL